MSTFELPISEEIWDMKYRLKDEEGNPIDVTVEDTWERVAFALAQAEADDDEDYEGNELLVGNYGTQFMEALEDWKYLPAGRIIAGAGTDRDVTLFNCYVMGTVPDSLDGIFEMLKEAALTMQQGGGIGYDFSTIRPKGALVKGVAADASGPLSFMDVWDSMCKTIMSAGGRRGAMMATLRCDHPDIMDFITAKHDPARLRHFNVSVLCTDAFMEAVARDEDWLLTFEGKRFDTIKARTLWDAIMDNTYSHAEPGVIFIDRINDTNNLRYVERIAATNPCGEQPLPPYGACLLGSINLARLVKNPYSGYASIVQHDLAEIVATAVRMMDNVIDVSKFPLESQAQEARDKRRLGLGMTGLADALLMCGLEYGTKEAAAQAEEWARIVDETAYRASVEIAKEKGPFPAFEPNGYLAPGTHASTLPNAIKHEIRKHGIRNSHLTSIAPTGTISIYGGNVSSGIEPIFAASYKRKVTQMDGTRTEQEVVDYAVHLWRKKGRRGEPPAQAHPPAYIDAQTLSPEAHVRMQAAVQKHVDSSISKTINVPKDIDFQAFKDVYWDAYESGCKGCTTYRPNDVTGSMLSVDEKPDVTNLADPADATQSFVEADYSALEERVMAWYGTPDLTERPSSLPGLTHKIKFGDSEHAIYITLTDIENPDGTYRPFEIFINTKDPAHAQWMQALTRMISSVFRRGGDVSFVPEELKQVFDPKGGAFHGGRYVPSLVAAIGQVIEDHMATSNDLDTDEGKVELATTFGAEEQAITTHQVMVDGRNLCPKCFSSNMAMKEGCETCLDCGHSKCG